MGRGNKTTATWEEETSVRCIEPVASDICTSRDGKLPASEASCNNGEEKKKSKSREKRHKKKPRPPKRIRDKLKQLVPPEQQEESTFEAQSPSSIQVPAEMPILQSVQEETDVASIAYSAMDGSSTSGIESATSSNSSTGTTSPLDNSPAHVRKQSTLSAGT